MQKIENFQGLYFWKDTLDQEECVTEHENHLNTKLFVLDAIQAQELLDFPGGEPRPGFFTTNGKLRY